RGSLGEGVFAGVWSSDLSRCTETARLAAGGARRDERLRELNFGTLEGLRWADCSDEIRRSLLAFDDFRAPGGESVRDLRERVGSFLGSLEGGEHLVFTHGGVIRSLLRERARDRFVEPGAVVLLPWPSDRMPPGATTPSEAGAAGLPPRRRGIPASER